MPLIDRNIRNLHQALRRFVSNTENGPRKRTWSKFGHYSEEQFSRLRDDLC